ATTTEPMATQNTIVGRLQFDNGSPAAGVRVRVYQIGFGGKDTLLHEGLADARGDFAFNYQVPQDADPNIQLRAVTVGNDEIVASATRYRAATSETFDVVVPKSVTPLASEYERIAADLGAIGGPSVLSQALESPTRQDLTLLNETTGWDARLLALAAA